MLVESILFLVTGSDPTNDTIPGYALLGILIATPFGYAIGHLAIWA